MPSVDIITPEPIELGKDKEAAPASLPSIGIIYPPPEVRNIVDKTASFVARNGPEFESRIRQNEIQNPKFNFLSSGDPYHFYYQHKVKEYREGRGKEVSLAGTNLQKVPQSTQLKQQELLKQAQVQDLPFVPKDPPPEFEFVCDPPTISALDLDIVKLTAQFVAKNGRQFLTTLMNKEQRNYQFDFLRPQHSLFQYFTKLLEQYTKILMPSKEMIEMVEKECTDPKLILNQVKYRSDWQRHEEAQKRKEEQLVEKERVAYAQIDWHDFVVVETVEYFSGESGNFPPPTNPKDVGTRVLMQDRDLAGIGMDKGGEDDDNGMDIGSDDEMMDRTHGQHSSDEEDYSRMGKANTQVEDMDEASDSEDEMDKNSKLPPPLPIMKAPELLTPAPPLPPLPPSADRVIIKKGYDPKTARIAKSAAMAAHEIISPLTGTKIPANKVAEHLRIELLDPRWVEQRDKHMQDKMNQDYVYAPGTSIEDSLRELAERRTDIFGIGVEETAIGKKIGEEDTKKDENKVMWDGHTSSVEATTRAARANISVEDQIHQIHKVKGLIADEEKEKIGPKLDSAGRPILPGRQAPLIPNIPRNVVPPPPMPKQPPLIAQIPNLPPQPRPNMMPPQPPPNMMILQGGVQMQQRPAPMILPTPQAQYLLPPGTGSAYMHTQQQMTMPGPNLGKNLNFDGKDEMGEQPMAKKVRLEESLIPEDQFMAKQGGETMTKLKVVCPSIPDKADWNCGGQVLELTLPWQNTVSALKAKIHEITFMPPAKQKLNWEGLFLKDSNTLAYYNVTSSTMLQLQVKERGGRKK